MYNIIKVLCLKQPVVYQSETHLEDFKSLTHETSNKTMKIYVHMSPCFKIAFLANAVFHMLQIHKQM